MTDAADVTAGATDPQQQAVAAKTAQSLLFNIANLAKSFTADTSTPAFSKSSLCLVRDVTLSYTQCLARDLEQFAKHAKRAQITVDDILLMARRNEPLQSKLREFMLEKGIKAVGSARSDVTHASATASGAGGGRRKRGRAEASESASVMESVSETSASKPRTSSKRSPSNPFIDDEAHDTGGDDDRSLDDDLENLLADD